MGVNRLDTIGERIVYLRNSKGMTQRRLMDELNITNLGRVEKNAGLPGVDMIISISNYFNVTTDWLLKGQEKDDDIISRQYPKCYKHDYLLTMLNKLNEDDKLSIVKIVESFAISNQVRQNYAEKR